MNKRNEIAKELILMCQGVHIQEEGEIGIGWLEKADKIIDLFLSIKCDRCGEILTEFGGLAFSPPLDNKHTKTHICQKCWKLFEVWKRG